MEPALMTMQALCERSWELRPLCETLLGRLVAICGYTDHFRQQEVAPTDAMAAETDLQWTVQVDAALSRFTLLLESLAATESAVFRLAVAPSPVRELRSLHVWLDASFRGLHAEHVDPSVCWAQQWEEELERVEHALQLAARAQVDAAAECIDNEQKEMAAVVKFAFKQVQDVTRRTKKKRLNRSYVSDEGSVNEQKDDGAELFPDHEESLRVLFRRLVRVCGVQVPVLPSWFLSPAEVALNPNTRFRGGPHCEIVSASWMRSRGQRKSGVQQLLIKQFVVEKGVDAKSEAALLQAVEAVQRESELLRDVVCHPHVLQLAGASTFGSQPFVAFVSPWAAPETGSGTVTSLEDYLNLSVDHRRQLFRLLAQAATGLQSLHEASLIHGDLCCANILVGDDGQARLSNLRSFSLSRSVSESEVNPPCTHNTGSLRWQAPELLKDGGKAELASDIYAFGMTLLEALSEELPWGFLADDEVRQQVLAGHMPSPPVGVEENVWSLVEAMCDSDQAARPDINTVVEELQALAEEERERDGDDKDSEDTLTPALPLRRVSSADFIRMTTSPFATLTKNALKVPELTRRLSSPTGNLIAKSVAVGIPVREFPMSPQQKESDSPMATIATVELRQKWLGVKINSIGNCVVVSKFLRAESGAAGEIEASGRVERGDIIVAINNQNVCGLDRHQIGAIVQSSPRPLEVSFKRDPLLLTDSFRFRGLSMDPRWRDRGSALPLPGPLSHMPISSGEDAEYENEDGNAADPFSIEIWFSLAELSNIFVGGILLGAQDVPFQETSDENDRPYVHQQLLSVDPMGNLWCCFLDRPTPICVARELSPNHWYQLVVTYGGNAGVDPGNIARNDQPDQLLTVYLNGEQRVSDAGDLLADWAKLRHVNVGSGYISGLAPAQPEPHFSGWFGFSGLVFDLRVWKRKELSSSQVQLLFRGSSEFIDEPTYSLRHDLLGEAFNQKTDMGRSKRSNSVRSVQLQGPPFADLVRTTWPRQVGAQMYS